MLRIRVSLNRVTYFNHNHPSGESLKPFRFNVKASVDDQL